MDAKIIVLPGDGIGPEVTAAAQLVLQEVSTRFGHNLQLSERLMGGCAIDRSGQPITDETMADCVAADAVLLGAVGGPKWVLDLTTTNNYRDHNNNHNYRKYICILFLFK